MSRVFVEVFNLSLAASWLIAAVVIVRALISRRMPKWICCCMWGLVAIRLLVPFTVQSDFSLVPDQELVIKETSPEEFYNESLPAPSDNSESGHESLPEYSVQPPLNEGAESVPDFGLSAGDNTDKPSMPEISGTVDNEVSVNDTPVVGQTDKAAYEWSFSASTARVLSYVWVSGLIIMLSYAVISSLLLKRRVALSVPCGDGVRKGEGVDSPFVFGIFRPRIYIPYGLGAETEKCVIAHERAHLKRGDHLIKPLGFIILSVYWFNPLVWVAYVLLCRDIEYACDEKVIKGLMPEARKAYALALLDCAVAHKRIVACPVAFGETGVKERVKKTMNYKKPAFWIIICGIIACIVVALLFLTTGKNDADNESSADESVNISESSEVIESSSESQDVPWNTEELNYIDGLFAAETDIPKYDNCYIYESDEEYGITPIIFIPKTAIYEVKIFSIADNWGQGKIESILFEAESVTATKPLIADIKFIDSFAVRGISFTDENGNEHFYEISDSAVDGSLLISKFTNPKTEESNEESDSESSEPESSEPESSEPETSENEENDIYVTFATHETRAVPDKDKELVKSLLTSGGWSDYVAVVPNFIIQIGETKYEYALDIGNINCNGKSKTLSSSEADELEAVLTEMFAEYFEGNGESQPETSEPEISTPEKSEPEVHIHTFGDWVTVLNATCTAAGSRERACDCGEKEVQTIAKLNHSYAVSTVASTCKERGYTLHRCSCGSEYKDNYKEKSYEHDFPKIGTTYGYDCTVCGLRVCARGNYDGSMLDANRPIKYYITGSKNTVEERTLVIYGTGAIPDKSEYVTYWGTNGTIFNDEIKHIIIAEGITSIGARCFYDSSGDESLAYSSVKSISIPSTVTHIGDYAFYGVTFKGAFRLGKNVRTVGDNFMPQGCNSLYIPKTLQSINHDFMGWIYYEGTKEEFAKIGFYDYYHGSCKYIDVINKYINAGVLGDVYYNAW